MIDFAGRLADVLRHIRPFRRQPAIADAATHVDFLAGRSAFVAQKKLFEYVKQRMGTSYPKHFEDDEFVASLDKARWRVYAACMSDLALWMAGQLLAAGATAEASAAIARVSHARAVDLRFRDGAFDGDTDALQTEFEARLALADWTNLANADFAAFERSSHELVRWAPISDQLKRHDREIVENSLRFAWLDVREAFRSNVRPAELIASWRAELQA